MEAQKSSQFNKFMLGRELRVIEIKQEVNELLAEAGNPPRYKSLWGGGVMKEELRILIIEDSAEDAALIEDALRNTGIAFSSTRAAGRDEFVSALERMDPDVVLSDYSMPEFDALSALHITKGRNPFTPFIVVSGSIEEETALGLIGAGADDYILRNHLARLWLALEVAIERRWQRELNASLDRELRESERRYREIVENASDWIYTTDPNGVFLSLNAVAKRDMGLSDADIGRVNCREVVDGEYLKIADEMERRRVSGEANIPPYELLFHDRKGGDVWVEVGARIIKGDEGRPAGFQVIARNISERKLAEKSISESEERFEALFNGVNDAITVAELGDDGLPARFIEVNEVACRRLGYSREDLLALSPGDIVAPEAAHEIAGNMRELLEKARHMFETVNVDKDGRRIPVEVNAHVFVSGGRRVILAVVRDITERLKARNMLRDKIDYIERLNNMMVGRETRLAELKEEINGLLRELGRLPKYGV